ncbi:MAG TPA: hypothetical protein VFS09_02545 [Candidatus Eisenbacteria bacterium]|nr:hypothetical protein [Candidatus Eisenbacteria bacterium]
MSADTAAASGGPRAASPAHRAFLPESAVDGVASSLVAVHGAAHAEAIRRGARQVAERWWREDGDDAAFADFCRRNYLADEGARARAFSRISDALEQIDGLLHELHRELRRPMDTDTGPLEAVDLLFADTDLFAHVEPDLFRTKIAFFALLNFPVHRLEERLRDGAGWSREEWARSCLMERFAVRAPAELSQEMTRALNAADVYVSEYDILMDRVLTTDGRRPFPEGLRLISHWGLRDELKANYAAGEAGLEKQRIIQRIMERIERQEIPLAVRANPDVLWCPETNEVGPVDGSAPRADLSAREPDTRYEVLLGVFHAVRALDPYAPTAPTFIQRRFDLGRQMTERDTESLLVSLLEAPEVGRLVRRVAERLGRPLEPFDVWYTGYLPRASLREEELDAAVQARFRNIQAFQREIPDVLRRLGFAPERAAWLAERILVDPARGAGHAMGAQRREDKAHLRTRVPAEGMNYQGYNVAMHELGHNVEQIFSLNGIDHWALNGVPNTAFTEAFAFTFQERDLSVLGMGAAGDEAHHREALHNLWLTIEICGVSLLDMRIWNWLYAHPRATPVEAREATLAAARDVWNRWFAPHYGVRDVDLLAIYSHIVNSALYLPDYAIGHIVAFQLADRLRKAPFGDEVERLARLGRLTPDAWMRAAVGGPVSAAPMLAAARAALDAGF